MQPKNERVVDWMIREHPEEKQFFLRPNRKVTFEEVAWRMSQGEICDDITQLHETVEREHIFRRLAEIYHIDYTFWYNLHELGMRLKFPDMHNRG